MNGLARGAYTYKQTNKQNRSFQNWALYYSIVGPVKTEQLDSFLLYLEHLRDDSEFFDSFYDIFYNKILKVENKSDAVSADFLCEETVGISNLDDADQLLIDV